MTETWDHEADLVVVGTGAAGLGAAVVAAAEGLSVLVLEKTGWLGGTTAYSAGTCWAPGHRHQEDPAADREAAAGYMDALIGDRADPALRRSYLDHAAAAIDHLERLGVGFWHSKTVVDYHPEVAGSGVGRALEPHTFDGRLLGRDGFARIRPPVPEFALFGGTMMVRRPEVNQLLTLLDGSPRAVPTALRLGARWARDRTAGWPRGTRLAMGNALVANLWHQLRRRSGQVWFLSPATELITDADGRVTGVVAAREGRPVRIGARRGVVLAAGGFPADAALRAEHLPSPTAQFTRAADGATGDTLALARAAGAAVGEPRDDNAMWFPSSIARRRDGSTAVFPHIWDRAKPGIAAVNADGHRFVDESVSYHRFTRAMYDSHKSVPTVPAWLVLDSATLHRYGLGMIRPHLPAVLRRRYERAGYLHTAPTISALAASIGVDPDGLERTVAAAGRAARSGVDSEFGKGQSPFGHQYGDPRNTPNPNLGPIETAPFHAVAVVPTPLATTLGVRTDATGRALDAGGSPVPGLYACGGDAHSPTASEYPGAGCQVGAGLTFGYLVARHAAGLGAAV
ncbi:FAD-dependent oxidoreductase [Pseudonocardia nematodicida]|uniref:FAD-dependent oxidoreductase n=1 Tax=Pseudonocardia nematodicida TaxID=1206997 RepID=A0ABV1KFT1_9PSEU